MTTTNFTKLEVADDRYLGTECSVIVNSIMSSGYGEAKTALGCRGAIKRGLAKVGYDSFERSSWYSANTVLGSHEAPYEWAIKVSSYLKNDKFYVESDSDSVLAVWGI